MTFTIAGLLLLLASAVILLLSQRLPLELTALVLLLFLIEGGYLTPAEAFSGFSSPVVLTLLAMFCVSTALYTTGLTDRIASIIFNTAGRDERKTVVLVMLAGAAVSSFMNNTAAAALLLPAVAGVAERSGLPPSKLLLPLSFATILGGTLTLIGTPNNLLAGELLNSRGLAPFTFSSFTPFGVAWVAMGILFFAVWGRHRLPGHEPKPNDVREQDLPNLYRLDERLFTLEIVPGSALAGETLAASGFGRILGSTVVSIERRGRRILAPRGSERLEAGDRLLARGRMIDLDEIRRFQGIEVASLESRLAAAAKAFTGSRFAVEGEIDDRTIRELDLRMRTGIIVLAIQRGDELITHRVSQEPLRKSDLFLAAVPPEGADALDRHPQYRVAERNVALDTLLERNGFVLTFPEDSPLIGGTIRESGLSDRLGVVILGKCSGDTLIPLRESTERIEAGDELAVIGAPEYVRALEHLGGLRVVEQSGGHDLSSEEIGVAEFVLSPRSQLIGRSLKEMSFRDRYDCLVLAILREGRPLRSRLSELKLRFGDALLLQGSRAKLRVMAADQDFLPLSGSPGTSRCPERAPFVLAAVIFMLVSMVAGLQQVEVAALLTAVIVVLCGAVTLEEVYRVIEWRIVLFIAAILPLGAAAEHTGLSAWLGQHFATFGSGTHPLVLLAAAIAAASIVSQLLDSSLTVILLGPVLIQACAKSGLPPAPYIMGVALGASLAFLTPFSHRAHLLVMAAGGYSPRDYLCVGLPLTVLLFALTMLLIPLIFAL